MNAIENENDPVERSSSSMKSGEEFKHHLLSIAPAGNSPHGNSICFRPSVEANNFDIPEANIVQLTVEMWRRDLVSLHSAECSLQNWLDRDETVDAFFHNTTDNGYVRVRLLAEGANEKHRLRREPIGFAAP